MRWNDKVDDNDDNVDEVLEWDGSQGEGHRSLSRQRRNDKWRNDKVDDNDDNDEKVLEWDGSQGEGTGDTDLCQDRGGMISKEMIKLMIMMIMMKKY